ncbi:uncharacterized protein LOC144653747 isoform X2 [Oculina patagonica]
MKWFGVLMLVTAVLGASENPDENEGINDPNLFEGDMILSKEQIKKAEAGEDIDSSRKRGSSGLRLWPNGVVPYAIDSRLAGDSRAAAAITAGMDEWTTKTCIRFKRRTSEQAYINFVFGDGCSSFVGRQGSRPQNINLGRGCWTRGIVAHEIGHAVGFYHEQSRPDRDTYITVLAQNIQDGLENNFRKYSRSTIDSLGTKYDYRSLMHYGSRAFSKNGLPTIQVKIPPGSPGESIGQRRGLSSIDAQQADLLYKEQCGQRPGVTTLPPTATQLPTTSGDECSNYQELSSADRSQGNTAQNNVRCDQRDLSPGWYRFTGAAGDQMPDKCVAVRRCGTHAPGWLKGAHPTVDEGVVTRRVCYHWSGSCCRWSNNIKVKNCDGFFVYELQDTPTCSLRYCGNADPGATTLPPTTTPAPTTPGDECSNYKVLSSATRAQSNTAQFNVRCDQRDLSTPDWYRFMGAAGDQIPDQCVAMRRCGTHATGWLNGAHPTVDEGVVTRRVCYHWSNNCCRWSNNIKVKNCGSFFVYELQRTPTCALRYCGNAGAGTTTLAPTTTQLPPTTASCQDRDRRCRRWPRFFCRFSRYVRVNCKKKCRRC